MTYSRRRLWPVDHQHFADVLHRLGAQVRADPPQRGIARVAVHGAYPDLDQLVRGQGAVDLRQYRIGQAFFADVHDGIERVGTCLERLALARFYRPPFLPPGSL